MAGHNQATVPFTTHPTPVDYTAGPDVSPDNSATFVVDDRPTIVHVTGGPTGDDEMFVILRNTAGDWNWHQIA